MANTSSRSNEVFHSAYLSVFKKGLLKDRVKEAHNQLRDCNICPRTCGVDRTAGELGVCRVGRYAQVASYFGHHGEERALSGSRGSGTIFFAGCSLRCVFCQNYDISQERVFPGVTEEQLAGMMLTLQARGCHNINLVTPSHVVPQILEALEVAIEQGLHIPLVYNSSGYDRIETLKLLDGIVDIYLPDFKFWDPTMAERCLHAKDYPEHARIALKEMNRQVGLLVTDKNGIAQHGLLVRHLVMPGAQSQTRAIFNFLASELSTGTHINIMGQYHPAGEVNLGSFPEINHRITQFEYEDALKTGRQAGLILE